MSAVVFAVSAFVYTAKTFTAKIYSATTGYHRPELRIRIGAQRSNSSHLIAAVKRESVWGVLPRTFATFAISEMILFFFVFNYYVDSRRKLRYRYHGFRRAGLVREFLYLE